MPPTSKIAAAASGSSVRLPVRPGRRAPMLLVLVLSLCAAGVAMMKWQRAQAYRPQSIVVAPPPAPQFWVQPGFIVPSVSPPATPQDKLERRLSAFARHVEQLRSRADPPLVAFGAGSLRESIEQAIARIDDRAQVSVHIRDLESGRVLFDYFGDTLLNPASNHKLLTTSAALDLLGAGYAFETRVLLVGEVLYLIGEGDPTIDAEALSALAHDVAERLPVGTISEIVVDDTAFSPQAFGPGYSTEGWGASYLAPSGALSLNFNTVEITVYPVKGARKPAVKVEPASPHVVVENHARLSSGPSELDIISRRERVGGAARRDPLRARQAGLTHVVIEGKLGKGSRGYKVRRRVVDPGMFTGGAFALMLAEASQSELMPVRIGVAPRIYIDALDQEQGDQDHLELPRMLDHEGAPEVLLVAVRRSPPLIDIIGGVLTYSNNFMAEQIIRSLGWRMTGHPGDWDNGTQVVRGYWAALGNDPGALVFENGSGMSSLGRVTTSGLVDLMAVAARTQTAGSTLLDALPVAGSVGTMRTRLRRSGKRVRAKTGTLDGVSGLTGVITTEDGEPQVAFSILINARESSYVVARTRRETEDSIVLAVLDHIDGWEAVRGTLILDLEPLAVTPIPDPESDLDPMP